MLRKRFCLGGRLLLWVVACSVALSVKADERKDLEAQLKKDYIGKVMTLRAFYGGDELRYSFDGKLLEGGPVGPWTLNGMIEIIGVSLKIDKLELSGNRLYLVYNEDKESFRYLRSDVRVHIEIRLDPSGVNPTMIGEALSHVFLARNEQLAEVAPAYWRNFLAGSDPSNRTLEQWELLVGRKVYRIRDGVSGPRCLSCQDPDYSEVARQAKLQGIVVLCAIINQEGRVEHLELSRPLGLGLDESAINAVSQWRLEPARLDGRPVPVLLTIEIHFHLSQ